MISCVFEIYSESYDFLNLAPESPVILKLAIGFHDFLKSTQNPCLSEVYSESLVFLKLVSESHCLLKLASDSHVLIPSISAFRRRLAHRLNLCIQSRGCQRCAHRTGHNSTQTWITRFINAIFGLSNIILLIYLGMPFDNNESAQTGYSMQHTLGSWKQWYFGGHLYSLGLLIASFLF